MTTRRVWIRLSLAAAWVAVAAVLLVPRTIAVARFLFLGPAVTFQAGRGPDGMVISPDGRTLYAADEGYWTGSRSVNGSTVTPVSTATGKPGPSIRTALWFPPRDESLSPISMAIAPDGRTLYAVDNGKIAVISIGT